MEQKDKDALILAATLKKMNEFRLPRAMSLKAKVDNGEVLSQYELEFLRRVFDDVHELNPILERNPEYLSLRDKAIGLCEQILEKNAENQAD